MCFSLLYLVLNVRIFIALLVEVASHGSFKEQIDYFLLCYSLSIRLHVFIILYILSNRHRYLVIEILHFSFRFKSGQVFKTATKLFWKETK